MPDRSRRSATWTAALVPVLALILAAVAAVADEAKLKSYGRHLAQECTGCHRIDGVDNGIPSIIGWRTDVFMDTVKFYQAGKRTNPVMVSVASSLNEEQITALAAYFGSLPKPAPKPKAPADKKAKK